MYLIVSWDIGTGEPQWSKINTEMLNCFKSLPQVRPVNTYYMVKANEYQHQQVHDSLLKIAQAYSGKVSVNFIISPLLAARGYKGWLPQDRWNKISEITG